MALTLTLWCLGTAGHFLLTGRWVIRSGVGGATRDERWFTAMVAGTGTLSVVLHLVSASVGLSMPAVLATLASGHALVWRRLERRPGTGSVIDQEAGGAAPRDRLTRALEAGALMALTAIVFGWVVIAVPSWGVSGTDAASYHIPNAVNLALGASPFDLPPTSHLYPMGSSTLAAWFILPLGDPLLTDLVMAIPFLLLVSALGWLFRLTTGLSGLAWATWASLALFSTPLFRIASLMSADLLFAASLASLAAVLLAMFVRRRFTRSDLQLLALSAGLLLGAKTTGVIGAALLLAPAVLAVPYVMSRGAIRRLPPIPDWLLAAVVAIGAGGLWLVRNWWLWGSPVVPNGLTVFGIEIFRGVSFEPTTYLSVLGDLERDAGYPLGERFAYHSAQWLGPWFLPALWLIALIPIDVAAGWIRRANRSVVGSRAALFAVVIGTVIPLAWLLAGAPWTSLEWTGGLSLRYAQPWWALLGLLTFVALFPVTLPWYERTPWRIPGGLLIAAAGLGALGAAGGPPFPPALSGGAVVAAAIVWPGIWLLALVRPRRRHGVVAAAAVAGLSVAFGIWTARAGRDARAEASLTAAERTPSRADQVYQAALAAEDRLDRACKRRRFFTTTRFDEPLGLQGIGYTNLVFYAARDVSVTATVPSLGPCDYVISTRDVLSTRKGVELLSALNPYGRVVELEEVAGFVLLARQ